MYIELKTGFNMTGLRGSAVSASPSPGERCTTGVVACRALRAAVA